MPSYKVYSGRDREHSNFDGRVTAQSKADALGKAREMLQARFDEVPDYVSVELAPPEFQKQQRASIQDRNLVPRKRVAYRALIKRTNKPGTCLWCGNPLRRYPHEENALGDKGDNCFCGVRCGYEFGVTAAVLDFRLQPRDNSTGEDGEE